MAVTATAWWKSCPQSWEATLVFTAVAARSQRLSKTWPSRSAPPESEEG